MRKTLTTLYLLCIFTIEQSFCDTNEELVASGYNLDSAEEGDVMDGDLETKPQNDSPKLNQNQLKELAQDTESAIFINRKNKSFLQNEDVISAIVTGGVLGAVVASILAALYIFKWQKCGNGRYPAGQETTSHL